MQMDKKDALLKDTQVLLKASSVFAEPDDHSAITITDKEGRYLYINDAGLLLGGIFTKNETDHDLSSVWQRTHARICQWDAIARKEGVCTNALWLVTPDHAINRVVFIKRVDQDDNVLSIYVKTNHTFINDFASYNPKKKHFVTHRGEVLNPRDIATFGLYVQGMSNSQIAERIHLSLKGVDARLSKTANMFNMRPRELRKHIQKNTVLNQELDELLWLVGAETHRKLKGS